jgi:hypothetical protein
MLIANTQSINFDFVPARFIFFGFIFGDCGKSLLSVLDSNESDESDDNGGVNGEDT